MLKKVGIFVIIVSVVIVLFSKNDGVANVKEGVKIKIFNVIKGEYEEVSTIANDKDELRKSLTKEQFHITQEEGTEAPFSGALLKNKETGVYQCVVCKTDIFRRMQNMTRKQDGRVFGNLLRKKTLEREKIIHFLRGVLRCIVPNAVLI